MSPSNDRTPLMYFGMLHAPEYGATRRDSSPLRGQREFGGAADPSSPLAPHSHHAHLYPVELPQVRHCRVAVRAVLNLTDWSPEAVALGLPEGGFSRVDSDVFDNRRFSSTRDRPNSLLTVSGLEISVWQQQQQQQARNTTAAASAATASPGMKRSIARSTSPTPAGGDPDVAPLAAKKLRTARGGSRPGPLEISVAPTMIGVSPGDPPVSPASPATPSDAARTSDPSDASAKRDSGSARLSGSSSAAAPVTAAAVAADDGNVYLPASLAQYAQKRASDSSSILSAWNAILSSRELQRTTDPAADTGGIRGRGLTQTPPPTSSATAAGAHSAASSLTHGPHLERSHFTCEHQHEWVIPGYGRVRFTDYAPLAFKALREKFGYDTSELTAALEEPLTVEKSSGKSDSVFFITQNKRFLFKTLRGTEPEELRALLPEYLNYIHQNPDTLLPRYLGMYTFQTVSRQPSYARVSPKDKPVLSILSQVFTVVVMASVFDTDVDIHEKYDFKGSTVGRQTLTDEMDITNGVVTMRRRRLSEGVSRPPRMADTKPRPLSSSSSTFEGGGSLLEPLDAPSLWKLEGSEQGFAAGGGTGSSSVLPSLHEGPSYATDNDSNLPASAGQLLADLTLKELDFQRLVGCGRSNLIHLGDAKREGLIAQLESDFSLLRKNGFMDYSVLVGIHRKKKAPPCPPPTPHRRFPILDSLKGLASPSRPLSFFFGGGANPADASPAAAPADLLAPPTPVARPPRDASASPTRRKSTLFGVLGGNGGVVPTPGSTASGDAQGRSMTPQEALLRRAVAAAAAAAAAARGARASAPAVAPSVPAVAVAAAPNDSAAITVDIVDAASEAHPDGAPQQAASPKSVECVIDVRTDPPAAAEAAATDALPAPPGMLRLGSASSSSSAASVGSGVRGRRSLFSFGGGDAAHEGEASAHHGVLSDDEDAAPSWRGRGIRSEGLQSDDYEYEVYFIGIVDILQKYNMVKWFERRITKPKQPRMPFSPSIGAAAPPGILTRSTSMTPQPGGGGGNRSTPSSPTGDAPPFAFPPPPTGALQVSLAALRASPADSNGAAAASTPPPIPPSGAQSPPPTSPLPRLEFALSLGGLFGGSSATLDSDAAAAAAAAAPQPLWRRERARSVSHLLPAPSAAAAAGDMRTPPPRTPATVPLPLSAGGSGGGGGADAEAEAAWRARPPRAPSDSRGFASPAGAPVVPEALFSTPEVSVEEPGRYAARLMRYMAAITV